MPRSRLKAQPPRVAVVKPDRVAMLTIAQHVRLPRAEWEVLRAGALERARYICQCGECRASGRLLPASEVDHIVPLWKGGTDAPDNLQAINRDCHARKTKAEATMRASGDDSTNAERVRTR